MSAALDAFAEAPQACALLRACYRQAGDFEKGEVNGATASLALVRAVAEAYPVRRLALPPFNARPSDKQSNQV